MQKLFAVDLDGTLLYPKHPLTILSLKTRKMIQRLVQKDNVLAFVTGRSLDFCLNLFKKIHVIPHVIACCGSLIYSKDEVVEINCLERNILLELIDFVKSKYKPIGIYISGNDGKTYMEEKMSTFFLRIGNLLYNLSQGKLATHCIIGKKTFYKAIEDNSALKIMFLFGIGKKAKEIAKKVNKEVYRKYGDVVESCWTNQAIEITSKGYSKNKSILKLATLCGIRKENVVVLGDSGNDIPMFKEFYENSYCMSKASSSVKKYAKYEIKSFSSFAKKILK